MKPLKNLVLFTALAVGIPVIAANAQQPHNNSHSRMDSLTSSSNAFAVDLYRQLTTGKTGNLFFSPFSIHSALAMTYAGAQEQTARQMEHTLKLTLADHQTHATFRRFLRELKSRQQEAAYQLWVANALWAQKGYNFRHTFLKLLERDYQAQLQEVDFRSQPEAVRRQINAWIADRTAQKIEDLMAKGSIRERTRLVLTNAVYFKAAWANVFREGATREETFTLLDGNTADVPLMHQTDSFAYGESPEMQVLALPYVKQDLSMVVLLPRTQKGLPALEKRLSPAKLSEWLRTMQKTRVRVAIPKFRLSSRFSLSSSLREMGMPDAFDPGKADFSGMTGIKDLFIQAVVHKAYVDVHEKGTEAAAATGITMGITAAPVSPPKTFRADHPFLFVIRDERTGTVLFMGRVTNPAE